MANGAFGWLMPDLSEAIKALGSPAPSLEETPTYDIVQNIIKYGSRALQGLTYPFAEVGMARKELDQPWYLPTYKNLPAEYYKPERIQARQMGGEEYEEYQQLPLTEQLKYEAPAWLAAAFLPGATQTRAALAPTATTRTAVGTAAKAGRAALAPLEAGEVAVSATLKYGIQIPLKYVVVKPARVTVKKVFEVALDTGLDKWLVRQGTTGNYANKVVEQLLKRNKYQLFNTAKDSLLRRVHPKATQQAAEAAAKVAADDTIRQIEPLLLKASEDAGIKVTSLATTKAGGAVTPQGLKIAASLGEIKPPITAKIVGEVAAEQTEHIAELLAKKALTTPSGGYKPQLRNFLISQIGRRGTTVPTKQLITEMTSEQADTFIEALRRLPDPVQKGGKLVPPTLPKKTTAIPPELMEMKFGKPTIAKYFTSQMYYTEQLGVAPLTRQLEIGKQRLDIAFPKAEAKINKKIAEIDRVFGTTPKEKITAKIRNQPTEAVRRMRNYLNKYESAPEGLSKADAKLFAWFRDLTHNMLNAQNNARAKLGIEQIPHRDAYVRHVADNTAWNILNGQRELPPNLEYWSKEFVGKKIFNPMELHRKLAVDLEDYFTKDLGYAMKSMVRTALREIYLDQPLEVFSEQMAILTKDMPTYKSLTAQERERLQKIGVMPESTRRWLTSYVNANIKGQQTETDAMINRLITETGLGGMLNKALAPFGRVVGERPFTKLAFTIGRLIISATIGPRPKLIIRNLFQNVQNIALYGVTNATKALLPAPRLARELMNESLFLKGYARYEELPQTAMAVMERLWMAAYGRSAVFNASNGMKAAYYDIKDLITNPQYKEYGWADPQRTYNEPKNFLYPSERAKLLREMEFGSGCTQYQYISMAMPEIFRHKTLIPFTRLQSWWMNYFFKFQREALHRFIKGETSYGAKLPWNRRLNWLKYMVLGGAILTGMGYKRSYMTGVLPYYMSPGAQIGIGLYNYLFAPNDWQRDKAKSQIYQSWKAFVPGSLAWNDFNAVWKGEKPLSTLFFYTEDWPPSQPSWGIPALEEKDPLEKIEAQIIAEYDGVTRNIYYKHKALNTKDPQQAKQYMRDMNEQYKAEVMMLFEAKRRIKQAQDAYERGNK